VQLLEDIETIFAGECIYIANFMCKSTDFSYLQVDRTSCSDASFRDLRDDALVVNERWCRRSQGTLRCRRRTA
jgi:hypothetical protein